MLDRYSGIPILTVAEAAMSHTWLIADTHFDHTNIIRYCNRPFSSVEAMNETILKSWKGTVADGDTVFFLGDLALGRGSRTPRWWLEQLPGNIIFVKGSHDHGIDHNSRLRPGVSVFHSVILRTKQRDYGLIHKLEGGRGDGWFIRGHIHNTQPFIDRVRRLVNVSVEAIGYKPVSLAHIISAVG